MLSLLLTVALAALTLLTSFTSAVPTTIVTRQFPHAKDPAVIACAQGAACQAVKTAWLRWTTGFQGLASEYPDFVRNSLCYADESPPTRSFSGNLQACAACVDSSNTVVSSQIPNYFHNLTTTNANSGVDQGVCDQPATETSLDAWTRKIFYFGQGEQFPINLPFGTFCTGNDADLPWPVPSANPSARRSDWAVRDVEVDTRATVNVQAGIQACLDAPDCSSAQLQFAYCMQPADSFLGPVNNCLCESPRFLDSETACATCLAPSLKIQEVGSGSGLTFSNLTSNYIQRWCQASKDPANFLSRVSNLIALGNRLSTVFESPVAMFNVTLHEQPGSSTSRDVAPESPASYKDCLGEYFPSMPTLLCSSLSTFKMLGIY